MKAILFPKYNSFSDLQLIEKDIPTPQAQEVVVKIKHTAFNALDWHVFRGVTLVKFKCGFRKPKEQFQVLGADISGTIVEVGNEVDKFKKGDEVFGDIFTGGFAEYAAVPVSKIIHKPEALSHEQAAASPVAGMTALEAVKRVCSVKEGDHVLINGASGGVGSYCVLFCKALGAKVTAVSSAKNHDYLTQLGADEVIDYQTTDFCRQNIKYDWILEVAGNRTPREVKKVLKPNGKCAVIGFSSAGRLLRYLFHPSSKVKMVSIDCTTEGLEELATFLIEHDIQMPISKRFTLKDVPAGIKALSTKRTVGKMLVDL